MISLKASQHDQQGVSTQNEEIKEFEEEEIVQEEVEDELALISKKIQRMMRRRDQIKRKETFQIKEKILKERLTNSSNLFCMQQVRTLQK